MSLLNQLRGFIRAFRAGASLPSDDASSSLAETLKDSTHVRGGHGTALPRAGTEAHHKIVSEGHENYTDSFKKKE